MVADALPQDSPGGFDIIRTSPKQKKLTFGDIQGYQELLESLVALPGSHAADMPKAPMLDAGQWVDAHFKQVCARSLQPCLVSGKSMRLVQGICAVPLPYRHSAIVGAMPLMLLSCACNCLPFCLQEGYGWSSNAQSSIDTCSC
jgi:hypothetical protein